MPDDVNGNAAPITGNNGAIAKTGYRYEVNRIKLKSGNYGYYVGKRKRGKHREWAGYAGKAQDQTHIPQVAAYLERVEGGQ